jgi:hypothetical protein
MSRLIDLRNIAIHPFTQGQPDLNEWNRLIASAMR